LLCIGFRPVHPQLRRRRRRRRRRRQRKMGKLQYFPLLATWRRCRAFKISVA